MTAHGSTHRRGYGWQHQAQRARVKPLVESGRAICWRCRRPIHPLAAWDLGHDDRNRLLYRGPEHRACNRAAARRKHQPRPAPALAFFNTTRTP
jgi:hypothetical protein